MQPSFLGERISTISILIMRNAPMIDVRQRISDQSSYIQGNTETNQKQHLYVTV